jgi:hypothetical protein
MKLKTWIIAIIALGLTACHPSRYIHDILENEVHRGKLYHEILQNETYRAQLLDSIQNNNKTKMLLKTRISDSQNRNVYKK